MASPRVLSLSRTFASFLLPRTTPPSTLSLSLLRRLRPIAAVSLLRTTSSPATFRTFSTRQSQNSLNDNSPNWSNRPPKETILLDGCDFEHWLVVTEPPPENATRDEIIESYIKTLAQVVGSEDEARMKIYSVSTRCYYAFGALVSEELSYKLKELPNVRWVLPDSYLDVKNKDYGGEPFINGQAVPYDPKYHEEWIRNNQKAQERNRRNDRPRNADRSRNFERRQRTSGPPPGDYQNNPNPGGANMGGGPGGNPGYGQNRPQNNPGYGQNMPQNNPAYGQNMQQNNPGFAPGPNRGMPNYQGQGNPGFQGNQPNYQGGGNPGFQGNQPNYQGGGNPGFQGNQQNYQGGRPQYQNAPMPPPPPPPQNYAPQGQPSAGYQGQDVSGRDMPQQYQ